MAKFFPINTPLINYFFFPAPLPINGGANQPIAGGKLFFFDDADRNVPLPTFSDVFDPQNPVVNTNPIVLGDAGEVPLFYLENRFYFIILTNAVGDINNPIETFEHYNPARLQGFVETFKNYIGNAQFWAHNFEELEITEDVTNIAAGNWFFVRGAGATSTDIVSFERDATFKTEPSGNPRYSGRLHTTNAGAGAVVKQFERRFRSVNLFASTTQEFTFGITLTNNESTTIQVELILLKNFGTGGSGQTELVLTTFDVPGITPIFFTHSFIFGDNLGKTIGSDDDDFVGLVIRFPGNALIDAQHTDWMLAFGEIELEFFPPTTVAESQFESQAGLLPLSNPDGSDLFLPIRQGLNGFEYDDSSIGVIEASFSDIIAKGTLLCDGEEDLAIDEKSSDGIPFKRLFDKIGFKGGRGKGYYSFLNDNITNVLATSNQAGAVTAIADGTLGTGFDFVPITVGTTDHGFLAAIVKFSPPTELVVVAKEFGSNASAIFGNGTSPLSVSIFEGLVYDSKLNPTTNSRFIYFITGFGSSLGSFQSTYFLLATVNPNVDFYIWYNLDGAGVDPAPGGIGIEIKIFTGDSEEVVIEKTTLALNAFSVTEIRPNAASTLSGGENFIFNSTNPFKYIAWFSVDGAGTAPVDPAARKIIKISVAGSDTANEVATKIGATLNQVFFSTPVTQGMFLRGDDPSEIFDPERKFRLLPFDIVDKTNVGIGSIQFPMVLSHAHDYDHVDTTVLEGDTGVSVAGPTLGSFITSFTGLKDCAPWNITVKFVIRY